MSMRYSEQEMNASSTQTIVLAGQIVPYVLRFSARAMRGRIKVGPTGVEVVLPAPEHAHERASTLLHQHASWVLRHIQRVETVTQQRQAQADTGRGIQLLCGQEIQLCIHESNSVTGSVTQRDHPLTIHVTQCRRTDAPYVLEAWLRREARHDLLACIRARSVQMGIQPARMFLMNQRTRWGSCSRKRNLSFNWRLVLAPPEILDYVVVHELAHLCEMNHSKRFWSLVGSFCPDFEQHRRWLKDNGWRLTVAMPI